jgi:hypothetical protein
MSGHIPAALVRDVADRASNLCEYCQLPQATQEATFHVDHVHPRPQEGPTTLENLALACVTCSLKKAARTHAIDPDTNQEVQLFNPRTDSWTEHFQFSDSGKLLALTPIGRATVELLAMNRPAIVMIRLELAILGRFPPR